MLRPARPCGGNLHRILKVRHREGDRVAESRRIRGRNGHETDQLGDEVTSAAISALRSHQVVEVRQAVPRHEDTTGRLLDPLEEFGRRSRMGPPIEGDVDQDVGVQQHQRYLRASAA